MTLVHQDILIIQSETSKLRRASFDSSCEEFRTRLVMSLRPPQRDASPIMTTTTPEDDSLILRVSSMDSTFTLSEHGTDDSWACPKCSYLNIDTSNKRCALCGTRDQQHFQENKRKKQTNKNNSWLSLGSAISRMRFQEGDKEKEETVPHPPTHQEQRIEKSKTHYAGSSRDIPLKRPGREEDDEIDDAPPKSLPGRKISAHEPAGGSKDAGTISNLSGSSLSFYIRYSNNNADPLAKKEKDGEDEAYHTDSGSIAVGSISTTGSITNHSRATVKISNRQPSSLTSENEETPTMSNITRQHTAERSASSHSLAANSSSLRPRARPLQCEPASPPIFTIKEGIEQASYLPQSMAPAKPASRTYLASSMSPMALVPPVRKDSSHNTAVTHHSSYSSKSQVGETFAEVLEAMNLAERGQRAPKPTRGGTNDSKCITTLKGKHVRLGILVCGPVLVAVIIVLLIVVLSSNSPEPQIFPFKPTDEATTQPASETAAPSLVLTAEDPSKGTGYDVQILDTEEGQYLDWLGSDVSVAGDWIAMVGKDFVRVMEYINLNKSASISGGLKRRGEDIMIESETVQVAFSKKGQAIATVYGDQVRMLHYDNEQWSEKKTFIKGSDKVSIASSCSISGNGKVLVAGFLRGPYSSLHFFNENLDPMQKLDFGVDVSESSSSIQVVLSDGGDVLAFMTKSTFKIFKLNNQNWEEVYAESPRFSKAVGFSSIDLSGDGTVLAVTSLEETRLFTLESDEWKDSHIILVGGVDVSLDDYGELVAIGAPVDEYKKGSVSMWHWNPSSDEYEMVQEINGEAFAEYGTAVSVANFGSPGGYFLAVGAPGSGKRQGAVDYYRIQSSKGVF